MEEKHYCRECKDDLTEDNWSPYDRKMYHYICRKCNSERKRLWRNANPGKRKVIYTKSNRKNGHLPMNENKKCPSYLGVQAEILLSHVFDNVERMPHNNPGFDFLCAMKKMVDVKGACLNKIGRWQFNIMHNNIADYFLCIAFDNRDDLNPKHVWLIPGDIVNHLVCTTISPSTVHKWDKYRIKNFDKVVACCNIIKNKNSDDQ